MKKLYLKIRALYLRISEKRYTTFAGTLVFFLLLSIVPFAFLSTILLNAINIDISAITKIVLLDKFSDILDTISSLAENATKSANLIFTVTAIYSSTNFFFHLKRSGEIIYNTKSKKKGVIARISAILWVFAFMLGLIIISAVFIAAQFLMSEFTDVFIKIIIYVVFGIYIYFVAFFLSVYARPYKINASTAFKGGFYVFSFWIIISLSFAFYLKFFANFERLYGALAFAVAFLIWLYLLMQGLIIGVILSGGKENNYEIKEKHKEFV